MTTVHDGPRETFEDNDQKPVGYGRMLRKEDPRFLRGRGRYTDDIQLPGMLHPAILRAPVAHARIVSVDISAARAQPKVKAVVTGAMLAEKNLAWMPTLSNDVQAVLATDKVRFQGQEAAFVVAEDRYSARDALEFIDVGAPGADGDLRRGRRLRPRRGLAETVVDHAGAARPDPGRAVGAIAKTPDDRETIAAVLEKWRNG